MLLVYVLFVVWVSCYILESASFILKAGCQSMCSTWVLRKRQEQDPKEELVCKEVIEDPSLQMVRWRVMIDSFSGNGGTWNQ